ncbi:probable pectinesterase 67 [Nymphaea colorata]|nr:probable pectinesterase 67 [Nymphaea colorata]
MLGMYNSHWLFLGKRSMKFTKLFVEQRFVSHESIVADGEALRPNWSRKINYEIIKHLRTRPGTISGEYRTVRSENVTIPHSKPFIYLEGEGRDQTAIVWGDHALHSSGTEWSATFTVLASVSKGISFKFVNPASVRCKNSVTPIGLGAKQAAAATIGADRSALHGWGYCALQDTLNDHLGRHFYRSCYIQGVVDFIFCFARSLYQDCDIVATKFNSKIVNGTITAHGRQGYSRFEHNYVEVTVTEAYMHEMETPLVILHFSGFVSSTKVSVVLVLGLSTMVVSRTFPCFLQLFLLSFAILLSLSSAGTKAKSYFLLRRIQSQTVTTIQVDSGGRGDFRTIQAAIDSIPSGNQQWITIHVRAGIYNEKVVVPYDKPFIFLEGEGRTSTFITWADTAARIGTAGSATFTSYAPNFVARWISFNVKNEPLSQAVAALVAGDMSAFYGCGFSGIQDTLFDFQGRHLFRSCYIEGTVDFIFGSGRSLFEDCTIFAKVDMKDMAYGYITAQGRDKNNSSFGSAFVFSHSKVFGTGPVFLGRAWRPYSRVIFYRTYMSDVIVPAGWDSWNQPTQNLSYTEYGCDGPGSDTSKRVKWLRTISSQRLSYYTSLSYIGMRRWSHPQHNSFARQIPEPPIHDDGL